ncbi:MAG: hypothetical protein IPH03_06690 [Tetrasphaera sp.]|nr:hypothetical protein [Tetrasphaera sp.]
MSTSLIALATEGAEKTRELPMPAVMYAVIALVAFALLLAVTWAFRGTAAKLGQGTPIRGGATAPRHSRAGHH